MSNKELFDEVRALGLPDGGYALFGSTPMGIRGIKECRDADILTTEGLWAEFEGKEGWVAGTTDEGSRFLSKGNLELWKDWAPGEWDVMELIGEAETIEGLRFVRLETVREWKARRGKEKDLRDIAAIDEYLRDKA